MVLFTRIDDTVIGTRSAPAHVVVRMGHNVEFDARAVRHGPRRDQAGRGEQRPADEGDAGGGGAGDHFCNGCF